jgi:hypothetical protein
MNLLTDDYITSPDAVYQWLSGKLEIPISEIQEVFPYNAVTVFMEHWASRIRELHNRNYYYTTYLVFKKEKEYPEDLEAWFDLLDLKIFVKLLTLPRFTKSEKAREALLKKKWEMIVRENKLDEYLDWFNKRNYVIKKQQRIKRLEQWESKAKRKLRQENPMFFTQLWPEVHRDLIKRFNEKYPEK